MSIWITALLNIKGFTLSDDIGYKELKDILEEIPILAKKGETSYFIKECTLSGSAIIELESRGFNVVNGSKYSADHIIIEW
jgi:hypothetical protein